MVNNEHRSGFGYVVGSSCATGENWQSIMLSCAEKKCQPSGNSCGSNITYLYFSSFYVLSSFLVSYYVITFYD